MRPKLGVIIAALCFGPQLLASSHAELPPRTVSVRAGITTPAIPLTLQSAGSSSKPSLQYDQNSNSKIGMGMDYSWFGFFVSVDDMEAERDVAQYGQSQYSDFQLHSYLGALGVDLYLQDFKGYYLLNTEELTGDECCLLRDDLRSRFVGINLFYVLRPDRLSMLTAGSFLGIQKRSGGSWMLFGGASVQEFMSDTVLAPAGFENDYGLLGSSKSARLTTSVLGAGYGYTGILSGSFFIHLSGLVGLGPQRHEIKHTSGNLDQWSVANKSSMRATLGWSARRTFGGIQVIFDSTSFQLEEELLTFNSILTFLSIGFRFGI